MLQEAGIEQSGLSYNMLLIHMPLYICIEYF
jgi:hypothetical protein